MDKFKSIALEGYLKNKFPQYFENGEISIDLNTSESRCSFKARLAGESSPIEINISHFDVIAKDGAKFLKITEVSSDRKWVDALLQDHLKEREFKLPSLLASAL